MEAPEPPRARRRPHATPTALPCLAFDPGRPPSSSPATPAAATAPANPAPPVPPPLRSLHQELPHSPVNPTPYLILIGSRRRQQITLPPKLPSAAELAAGDLLLPQQPLDHRENRPSRADPSPPSGAREEQPNAGDDRRSPALLGQRRETTRSDWSNLTSGPGGPTVGDPAPPPRV